MGNTKRAKEEKMTFDPVAKILGKKVKVDLYSRNEKEPKHYPEPKDPYCNKGID